MKKQYIHNEIGKEFRSIAGYYSYVEEMRLDFCGRQVLCAVGSCVADNSCCGQGEFYFVEVPGYIVSGETSTSEDGRVVSEVDSIENEEEKRGIKADLNKIYPNTQVNFL
jgi:hypothetical protein